MRAHFGLPSVKGGASHSLPDPYVTTPIHSFCPSRRDGDCKAGANHSQIRDSVFYGFRHSGAILEDCRKEWVPGASMGEVSCWNHIFCLAP
jgi:hypothetical protein